MISVLPSGNWVATGRPIRPGFLTEPPPVGERSTKTQFYVHYTGIRPDVAEAAPSGTVWVDVSGSELSYFESLGHIWDLGESFATIEHDIIVRPDIVEAFEECPEPWCVFGYTEFCHDACMEAWRNELGCTRFRSEVLTKVPDAVGSIPEGSFQDWHNVCDGLGNNLRAAGFSHHWHTPHARHDHWA